MKKILLIALALSAMISCKKENINPKTDPLVDIVWKGTLIVDTVATLYLSFGCPKHVEIKNFKHSVHYSAGLPPAVATGWRDAEAGKYEYLQDMTDTLWQYKYVQYTFHYEEPIDTVFR